jgi:hypothetical protein
MHARLLFLFLGATVARPFFACGGASTSSPDGDAGASSPDGSAATLVDDGTGRLDEHGHPRSRRAERPRHGHEGCSGVR